MTDQLAASSAFSTMMRAGCFVILSTFSLINLSDCKLCPATAPSNWTAFNAIHGNDTLAADHFECPSSEYPESHTECCGAAVITQCCLPERRFHEIDNRVAMAIAISVICCCVGVALLVIVCCFWSRCPLYNTCRSRYTESDVVTYAPTDSASNVMPPEPESKSQHIYVPNNLCNGAAV